MSRKLVFYVTKDFSNNAKHVHTCAHLCIHAHTCAYSISLTFGSKDQSQVGIEKK